MTQIPSSPLDWRKRYLKEYPKMIWAQNLFKEERTP